MRRSSVLAATVAILASAALTAPLAAPLTAQASPTAGSAPSVARAAAQPAAVGDGTRFLNHASYLAGFAEPEWYEQNIPFVDLPDKQIQDVYYYRWRVYKEHLRYTNPDDGWVSTEFLDCCGYAAPYQAISAAAGHHITDGRWVRDRQYDDDEIDFWLTGPGSGPKPANFDFGPDTTDWAHQYSFWLASAAFGRAQVTGDFTQLKALLPELKRQYDRWSPQFDSSIGLYWGAPVWDAMEFTADGYRSGGDPYHGGESFRPALNSYQFGDATAIAQIADMVGDTATASAYRDRAAKLKTAMNTYLWDPQTKFFSSVLRDNNPSRARIPDRQQVGYLPWMFGAADASQAVAWGQLQDPQGFASAYGPTTLERRSPYFMKDAAGCCHWNGPSWPFSTSQTLTGMANLLQSGQAQSSVTTDQYVSALATYAKTQYKNGKPYIAEAHDPDKANWIYDGASHSEDYSHSSYVDLVLSGLLGIRPQSGNSLVVRPLIPASWNNFAVENVPYHGHNVTVVWDRTGSVYNQGAGLRIWVDGVLSSSSSGVQSTTVTLSTVVPATTRLVNDAANPLRDGFPKPFASNTWGGDNVWNPIDGKTWYNEVAQISTRWTNYSSPNATDFWGLDFGTPTALSDIRFSGYDDGGGVQAAASYRLQYLQGSTWTDVPNQTRSSATPLGNAVNRITFPSITTNQVRLLFTRKANAFVGITEFQAWNTPTASNRTQASRWRTDEGTGSTLRDTVGSTPLTVGSGVQWTGSGGHTGVRFTAAGQSAESSGTVVDTTRSFTVSAWVRLDNKNGFATAVSQDGAGTSAFFLQYSKADDRLAFATQSGRALSDASPTLGRWYHLTGVRDAAAGTYTLYVDGVAQKTVSRQASGPASTGPLALGRALSGGAKSDWWPGSVSDVTVWRRAISPAEVSTLP